MLAFVLGACSGPVLANPPAARPSAAPRTSTPEAPADPRAVLLPRDDGPHDRLTEWWYYTGHLAAGDGRTFGFEYVVFRAERGGFPVSWASHLAVTDEAGQRFAYAQRSEIGPAGGSFAPRCERRAERLRAGARRGRSGPTCHPGERGLGDGRIGRP